MNNIFLAVLLATILVTSTVAVAEGASFKKPVNKFLRDNTSGGSKLSDLCFVNIGIEGNKTFSLKLDNPDCEAVEPEPEPTPDPDNDTDPVPDPEPTPDPEPVPDNDTDPIPEPEPQPTNNETRVINFVGDVHGSNGDKVFSAIKDSGADLTVVLGDLWYGDWDKFYETYGTLGNQVACVLGNHEYSDNTDHLALPYCGNDWFIEYNGVLLVGINANEGLATQLENAKELFANQTFMEQFDTVIFNSHQPCFVNEGAHHPVDEDGNEMPNFCKALEQSVPDGISQIYIAGHEHNMQKGETNGNKWFISGAGGREHYDCGTGAIMCNDSAFGFLQLKIEPDGKITEQFVNSNGGIVN